MAKKNFSKIENSIRLSAKAYQKRQLLEESDKIIKDKESNTQTPQKRSLPGLSTREAVLQSIMRLLKFIRKHSPEHFDKVLELRKSCKELSGKINSLSLEEWDELMRHHQRLSKIRTVLQGGEEGKYDDELIQREQKRLKKKGAYNFHISEGWDTV